MTSTTDTAGHPDVAEISDLTEGLLAPSRTADVRRHLDDCPLCADVYDSLEEIRGLLGSLPGPVRMPADVAGRIDAALAAEALLSATAPGDDAAAKDDRTSVSRETSTAGVLPTSPGSGSPASTDRPSGPRAATGPGRAHRLRHGRGRVAVIGTAFTAAALGLGAILLQTMGNDSTGKSPRAEAPESGSTVTFSEGTLESQVSELLTKNKGAGEPSPDGDSLGIESHGTDSGSPGVGTLITPAVTIPECVQEATDNSGAVLAAESGTYKGTSVYLVVQPDTSDSTKVAAYIVDAACVKRGSTSPGELLLTQSYTPS
ncbi:anti-sigma factor family protein [Streptomyces sp. NPDC058470]|uniref:anti-sigma factor family protein n=1 Tax=Streptomyces sp. NPDC058470 TaxID=3346515 RepID=UPI0036608264